MACIRDHVPDCIANVVETPITEWGRYDRSGEDIKEPISRTKIIPAPIRCGGEALDVGGSALHSLVAASIPAYHVTICITSAHSAQAGLSRSP